MPSCAVVVCGNRSCVANFRTCGVTYHRFPQSPELKEKWIDACGRGENWFPTLNSVICSSHFKEHCFQPTAKSRRLFSKSVPTLKLRLVFETSVKNPKKKIKVNTKKSIITPNEKRTTVEQYKIRIEKYKKAMQAQKLQIKRLQAMVRRYRKKSDVMKNILTALKNENVIGEDHLWLLESEAITKVSIITPKSK